MDERIARRIVRLILDGGLLRGEEAEALFDEDALPRVLVLRAEAGGVSGARGLAGGIDLVQGVDALALVVGEVHQIHGGGGVVIAV